VGGCWCWPLHRHPWTGCIEGRPGVTKGVNRSCAHGCTAHLATRELSTVQGFRRVGILRLRPDARASRRSVRVDVRRTSCAHARPHGAPYRHNSRAGSGTISRPALTAFAARVNGSPRGSTDPRPRLSGAEPASSAGPFSTGTMRAAHEAAGTASGGEEHPQCRQRIMSTPIDRSQPVGVPPWQTLRAATPWGLCRRWVHAVGDASDRRKHMPVHGRYVRRRRCSPGCRRARQGFLASGRSVPGLSSPCPRPTADAQPPPRRRAPVRDARAPRICLHRAREAAIASVGSTHPLAARRPRLELPHGGHMTLVEANGDASGGGLAHG
jgi:hypothetical protein